MASFPPSLPLPPSLPPPPSLSPSSFSLSLPPLSSPFRLRERATSNSACSLLSVPSTNPNTWAEMKFVPYTLKNIPHTSTTLLQFLLSDLVRYSYNTGSRKCAHPRKTPIPSFCYTDVGLKFTLMSSWPEVHGLLCTLWSFKRHSLSASMCGVRT